MDYTDPNIPVTTDEEIYLLLLFLSKPELAGLISTIIIPLYSRKADIFARSVSFIRWASEAVAFGFVIFSQHFHLRLLSDLLLRR